VGSNSAARSGGGELKDTVELYKTVFDGRNCGWGAAEDVTGTKEESMRGDDDVAAEADKGAGTGPRGDGIKAIGEGASGACGCGGALGEDEKTSVVDDSAEGAGAGIGVDVEEGSEGAIVSSDAWETCGIREGTADAVGGAAGVGGVAGAP